MFCHYEWCRRWRGAGGEDYPEEILEEVDPARAHAYKGTGTVEQF